MPIMTARHAVSASASQARWIIEQRLADPLHAQLLRMLAEAPGYPSDIASALGIDDFAVIAALHDLHRQEIVTPYDGTFGVWYGITPENFRDALTAALAHSARHPRPEGIARIAMRPEAPARTRTTRPTSTLEGPLT